jgi:programmed cell death protein 5
MAQMMAQQGGGGGGDAPATPEEMQAQDDAKQAQEEQRRAMLMNIMQPSARERRECCCCSCALLSHDRPKLGKVMPMFANACPRKPVVLPAAVARISLVKPDKARAIEDMILMAARRGQIQEKVRA